VGLRILLIDTAQMKVTIHLGLYKKFCKVTYL
jgi:hypothetical protein